MVVLNIRKCSEVVFEVYRSLLTLMSINSVCAISCFPVVEMINSQACPRNSLFNIL